MLIEKQNEERKLKLMESQEEKKRQTDAVMSANKITFVLATSLFTMNLFIWLVGKTHYPETFKDNAFKTILVLSVSELLLFVAFCITVVVAGMTLWILRSAIQSLVPILNRISCKHQEWKWIRNIYGDEINHLSSSRKTARSEWVCKNPKCQKRKFESDLHTLN